MANNNKIHLANDTEKKIYELIGNAAPNTTQWRLRDRLIYIVRNWKSREYRNNKISEEYLFYLHMYNADLPEGVSTHNDTMAWAAGVCINLMAYLDEQ